MGCKWYKRNINNSPKLHTQNETFNEKYKSRVILCFAIVNRYCWRAKHISGAKCYSIRSLYVIIKWCDSSQTATRPLHKGSFFMYYNNINKQILSLCLQYSQHQFNSPKVIRKQCKLQTISITKLVTL